MSIVPSTKRWNFQNADCKSPPRRNGILRSICKFFFSPYVVVGVVLGTALSYCLLKQFYFYQAVVLGILCLPLAAPLLLYAPRRTLLGLLVLAVPFNPSFHIIRNEWAAFNLDLNFWASDLILFSIYVYLLVSNTINAGQRKSLHGSAWTSALPLFLWITAGSLSILPAVEKSVSVIELIRMVRVLAIFVAVYHLVEDFKDIRFIIYCLLIAFAVQACLVFVEYGLGHPLFRLPGEMRDADMAGIILRPGGTMGHSGHFAKLSALCLPLCLATATCAHRKTLKVGAFMLLVAGLVALATTVSRVGIATSVFGLAWIFLLMLKRRRLTATTTTAALIFLIVGMGFSWFMAGDRIMDRIKDDQGSAASRPIMFAVAANVIKNHPLLGVGLNNYTFAASRYGHSPEEESRSMIQPVHNIYLLQASEIGILGAVCFLWFLFRTILMTFSCASRSKSIFDSAIAIALGVGISCSWLQGLVDWGFRPSIVHTSYLAILAGVFAAWKYNAQEINQDHRQRT